MNPPASPTNVIDVHALSRRFADRLALDQVSLCVPRGCVFGLVGENGAGKTTLIKHLLGLLKPQSGSVRVLGLDPVADPVGVLGRVGYLSEQRDLPPWMRIDELLRYSRAFYPSWDDAYAEELRQRFALRPEARVRHLSRGEAAKAGLLLALAPRPELLLLDEPSSGLDPLVRRDILEAIIRTVADAGRTVLFSSHLLEEVERIADFVGMMARGRLILSGPLEELKGRHRQLILHFPAPQKEAPRLAGALSVSGAGREWTVLCQHPPGELAPAAASAGATIVGERHPSLNEIFVGRLAAINATAA